MTAILLKRVCPGMSVTVYMAYDRSCSNKCGNTIESSSQNMELHRKATRFSFLKSDETTVVLKQLHVRIGVYICASIIVNL